MKMWRKERNLGLAIKILKKMGLEGARLERYLDSDIAWAIHLTEQEKIGASNIKKIVLKALKNHRKPYSDGDGGRDWGCPIEEQKNLRVAPKGEWLGSEKERKEALKQQKEFDEHTYCEFCELCEEIMNEVGK
jgi:hypothetical protein